MHSLCWQPLLRALETELAALLPEAERVALFRRAGRRAGQEAGAAPDFGLSLPETFCQPGLVAWWLGFLEGASPEGTGFHPIPAADGGLRFLPGGEPPDPGLRSGFQLPEAGALTPYQLAQVVDLSVDAILFIDDQRRIRAWNRGAEQMFGFTSAEAIGSYFDLLVPADLAASGELEELARRTVKDGRVVHYVTRRCARDGREIKVSLSRSLVRDTDGRPIGAGVVLRDISEAERLEKELAAARHLAEIGGLAAQIAHEVRNPLAGIHGALQILRRRTHPPEEEDVFDAVAAEIRRIDHLVSDLKRFARGTRPHRRRLELGAWAEDWASRMGQAGHQVEVHISEAVHVDSDPSLLSQVLEELLENSIEAAGGESRVLLRVGGDPTLAWLDFEDDGPGLPQELGQQVLQPFVTTKTRGSGLGLAICQRTLHALGGLLEILPTGHQGAAFRVRLPRGS